MIDSPHPRIYRWAIALSLASVLGALWIKSHQDDRPASDDRIGKVGQRRVVGRFVDEGHARDLPRIQATSITPITSTGAAEAGLSMVGDAYSVTCTVSGDAVMYKAMYRAGAWAVEDAHTCTMTAARSPSRCIFPADRTQVTTYNIYKSSGTVSGCTAQQEYVGQPISKPPSGGTPGAHAASHGSSGNDSVSLNASQITAGTLDNARVNWAAPSALGSGTPAAVTGTTMTATSQFSGPATGLTGIPAANLSIGSQATGDTLYATSGSAWGRRGIGTEGQVYTVVSGVPNWATSSASISQVWWNPALRIANGAKSIAYNGGDFTGALRFSLQRPSTGNLSITGATFYFAGGAAKTIRVQLWSVGGSSLKSVDVAVSATGTYTATFSSAYTMSTAEYDLAMRISMWQTDGLNYTSAATQDAEGITLPGKGGPLLTLIAFSDYAPGDQFPSFNGTDWAPIVPVITAAVP